MPTTAPHDARDTTPSRPRTARRLTAAVLVLGAGVGLLAAANSPTASGAGTAPPQAPAVTRDDTALASAWAQLPTADQSYLCTAFLASPDGTWQTLAAALSEQGVTREAGVQFLTSTCRETLAAVPR